MAIQIIDQRFRIDLFHHRGLRLRHQGSFFVSNLGCLRASTLAFLFARTTTNLTTVLLTKKGIERPLPSAVLCCFVFESAHRRNHWLRCYLQFDSVGLDAINTPSIMASDGLCSISISPFVTCHFFVYFLRLWGFITKASFPCFASSTSSFVSNKVTKHSL